MLGLRLVKIGAPGTARLVGIVVASSLIFCCSSPAFSAEPAVSNDEEPHLQLAPIILHSSLSGIIDYILERDTIGASKTTIQTLAVGLNAKAGVKSFIMQPWLAQVSGNLDAYLYGAKTNYNMEQNYGTVQANIYGDAALDLVKYSRFPFKAEIFRKNSITDNFNIGTYNNQTTGYTLTQRYATKSKRFSASAGYTSQETTQGGINPNYLDNFNLGMHLVPTSHQYLDIFGNTLNSSQPSQGASSKYDTVEAHHVYQPNMIFSLATVVNTLNSNYSLTQGNSTQQYDTSSRQLNSFASIRPLRSPLTVTSSVRFFSTDSSNNGIPTYTLTSTYFNLGANYLLSPYLRVYGSVDVSDSLGTQTVTTNEALLAQKQFITKSTTEIGGFRYSGSAGATLANNNIKSNNSTTGAATNANTLNLALTLYHALDKSIQLGEGRLAENLHQSLVTRITNREGATGSTIVPTGTTSPTNPNSTTLITGGYLAWTKAQGKETTLLRLSASDSRTLSGIPYSFQMINLQAARTESISRNESLQGSMSTQVAHAQSAGQTPFTTVTSSAEVHYTHIRAFKVLHLTFESVLHVADSNILSPQIQQMDQNLGTRSWENDFSYHIGRLKILLRTRVERTNSIDRSLIYFETSRTF